MAANSAIEWTHHTFQSVAWLHEGFAWLRELLRGNTLQAESQSPGCVGSERHACCRVGIGMGRSDQVGSTRKGSRRAASGFLREFGGRVRGLARCDGQLARGKAL